MHAPPVEQQPGIGWIGGADSRRYELGHSRHDLHHETGEKSWHGCCQVERLKKRLDRRGVTMKTNLIFLAVICTLLMPGSAHAVEKTKVRPGYIQPAKERIQQTEDSTHQPAAEDQQTSEEPSSFYPDYDPDGESSNPYSAADSSNGGGSSNDLVPPTDPNEEPGAIAIPSPLPDDPVTEDPP